MVTNKMKEEFLKFKLASDINWAKRALICIFAFQTQEEKKYKSTKTINNVGFTAFDAELLTSFAQQLNSKGNLSEAQEKVLRSKMPKYWKQVERISDQDILEKLIISTLN